jgi:putative peptidoglycan lipid II flippase
VTETTVPGSETAGTPPGGAPVVQTSGRAAGLVAAGIIVSRLFGLVRTWAFARYFGLTIGADAYDAAIRIPNFVRALLGEGAISASFIPVYSAALARGDARQAREIANALLGLLLAAVSVLTILGILGAPLLTSLIVTGLDPQAAELTTTLTRVMFPMTGLMVISGWCLGIQNSHRRFFISYASAALWSLAQIALLLGLGPRVGDDTVTLAWWLAWATLAGSLLQVAAQLPQVIALVGRLRPTLNHRIAGIRQILRNFVPVVIALGFVQISSFVDLRIGSHLEEGGIAALTYASQIYTLPVSVFGLSVAAASLPDFARDSLVATDVLRERLRSGWIRILFYIIPTTVVFIWFGDLVVDVLLRSGVFSIRNATVVSRALAAYGVGLIGYTTVRLLASAFYAMQDYRTPLRASVTAIVTSGILAFAFAWPRRHDPDLIGVAGIALGSAIGAYVNFAVLAHGLRGRLGRLFTGQMWWGTARIVAAAAAAAVVAQLARTGLQSDGVTRWIAATPLASMPHLVVATGTLLVFGGIFLLSAYAAGSQEAARWLRAVHLVRRPPRA